MSGAEQYLMGHPARTRHASSWHRAFAAGLLGAGLLGAGLVAAALSRTPAQSSTSISRHPWLYSLAESGAGDAAADDPCADFPFVRLDEVLCNNLGLKGPHDQCLCPEGIQYKASANRASHYEHGDGFHVRVHAIRDLVRSGPDDYDPNYAPEWRDGKWKNGIYGTHFGAINMKAGHNVSILLRAHDVNMNVSMKIPQGAITFFDMDTGVNDDHAVEYVKIPNPIKGYIVTNETEVSVTDDGEFTTFTATKRGGVEDNPTDPLRLTPLQKNRAVTVLFDGQKDLRFQIGSSGGVKPRIFLFVLRPALACSYTMVCPGGRDTCDVGEAEPTAFDDPRSPVSIVRRSA